MALWKISVKRSGNAACKDKRQRLEKGMRHQMENCRGISGCTQRYRHIPELRQCRIGNNPFDVILDDTEEAHEKSRNRTNDDNEGQGRIG